MAIWMLEPGHTAVEFRARHMMVTWVRGHLKDIHGRLDFDWDSWPEATFEGEIDATKLWSGEPVRDEHLRSADFFDVEHHPKITFTGRLLERTGDTHFKATADVTIRGNTRPVEIRRRLPRPVGDPILGRGRESRHDAPNRLRGPHQGQPP